MARFNVTRTASGNGITPDQARAQFGGNDSIDWASLPFASGALLTFSVDPATGTRFVPFTTANGQDCVITHPLDLVRLTQGPIGGWAGNFPAGEALLFTNDRPPPITDPLKESIVIHFRQPVRGVGLQFEGSTVTPSKKTRFKANLVLWDLDGSDWGQPNAAIGTVADGSAVFLGAAAANPVVSTVQIYVDAMNGQQIDFAIGGLTISD